MVLPFYAIEPPARRPFSAFNRIERVALIRGCDHIRLTRTNILICIVVASNEWYRVLKRIVTADLFIYGKQVIILEYLREHDGYTQTFRPLVISESF